MVSGMTIWRMEGENSWIVINQFLRDISREINPMVMEGKSSAMERSIRESGLMAIWREKVFFSGKMAPPTQDNGSITCSMATDTKSGPMELSTRATSVEEKKKVMASWIFQMAPFIRASSKTIQLRATGILAGLMGGSMKVSGRIIEFMGRAITSGLMVDATMGNISMGKRKVLESLSGLMAEFIEDSGRVGSKMAEESLFREMEWKRLESGVMARRLDGSSDVFFLEWYTIIQKPKGLIVDLKF